MRETGGKVKLVLFLSGKNHACPFAKSWRAAANIECHIEGRPFRYAA